MTDIEKLLETYESPYVPGEIRSNEYNRKIKNNSKLKHRILVLDSLNNELPDNIKLQKHEKELIIGVLKVFKFNFKDIHRQASEEAILLSIIFHVKKRVKPNLQLEDYPIFDKYGLTNPMLVTILTRLLNYYMLHSHEVIYNTCDTTKDTKPDKNGYYKADNDNYMHRLSFEDYHNCKLDKNDVIHHIDGDKSNNHPANLVCMSRKAHSLLHNKYKGKDITQNKRNKTGYYRVSKRKDKTCKQGFLWIYTYTDGNGKKKVISSIDIEKLEKKVKDAGLAWIKFEDNLTTDDYLYNK